jgi:hypothetical protein
MLEPVYSNENIPLRNMTAQLTPGGLWDALLGITPSSVQHDIERARIPDFLASENLARSRFILDYDRWRNGSISYSSSGMTVGPGGSNVNAEIRMTVEQEIPLTVPLHRAFYDADTVTLAGESWIENHFPLYISDENL